MIVPGMAGMGKTPPRKCPAGQQLYAPGTKSERCVKVATILPPKPKPVAKPAPIVTADFLDTLPLAPPPSSAAAAPSSAPSSAPSLKILGMSPRTAGWVAGALVGGLLAWYVHGRKKR